MSLASLTQVETSVAANNQAVAQARQNAMMGLNIAIGQLQKYAGVDPVLTGTRELTSANAVTNAAFTGVWDAGAGSANPMMWLVSGSEQTGATAAGVLSAALDPSDDAVSMDQIFVVGNSTVASDPANPTAAERQRRVKLVKQNITAPAGSVPGLGIGDAPRIGRYAWWVGDEGVKASLALEDRANAITYPPWYDTSQPALVENRRRMRQQIGTGPNYFRADGAVSGLTVSKEGFDAFGVAGGGARIVSSGQIALAPPAAPVAAGSDGMSRFGRERFYDFTSVSYSVLANTLTDVNRGLLKDLSLNPALLGPEYARYVDYTTYMEAPGSPVSGAPVAVPPINDVDSPRRRYQITPPPVAAPGAVGDLPAMTFGVAPVLTDLIVQYFVQRTTAGPVLLKSRAYVGLWNPYSSALVPPEPVASQNLNLEIDGLPSNVIISDPVAVSNVIVGLGASGAGPMYSGGMLRLVMPFDRTKRANGAYGTDADLSSWLPGRKYIWRTAAETVGGSTTNELAFYDADLSAAGWTHAVGPLAGSSINLSVAIPQADLVVRLKRGNDLLATYTMPRTDAVTIADVEENRPSGNGASRTAGNKNWQFAFAFRLKQPATDDADRSWIKTFDPRARELPATAFIPYDPTAGLTPSEYPYTIRTVTGLTQYLLYRVQSNGVRAVSSYNDVSLFELPRMPMLTAGALQHMQIEGQRPYGIGNSWGGAANAVFDRFFFSGLPATTSASAGVPNLGAGEPLPNWNLRVMNATSSTTLQAALDARSSEYLLQAGGFNINSTRPAAWRAVLSSVRFSEAEPFRRATIDNTGGSTGGSQEGATNLFNETFDLDRTLDNPGLANRKSAPAFFRFPQSAQEIYFWQDPQTGVPSGNVRLFKAEAFRRGVRGYNTSVTSVASVAATQATYTQGAGSLTGLYTSAIKGPNLQHLSTDQIEVLAAEIVERIRARTEASGPFRSMQEFLSPPAAGQPSLLEEAIDAAGMNADSIRPLDVANDDIHYGFSTLTLTQGDIMTALAPYLKTRSDTFKVRTYGESVNPATAESMAQVWLEATVQRMPETVNPADDAAQPTLTGFGRRYKILSFRWLTSSDI